MAPIDNDRITAPLKWIEIGENDKLTLEGFEREYSDGTNKRHNKISPTEGCFITKQPGCLFENVYWVKPDARQRYKVASYLHDLSLVRLNFSLNDASNIAPLDRNLHYAFDTLGVFAVTCAKETLKALIDLFNKPPFTDAKYELVLLHPDHFLPQEGNALRVFTEDGNDLSGKMYFVSPDGALREGRDNTQPLLPPFTSNRGRAEKDILNPFLVVLNAEIAFRRFREEPHRHVLCQDYNEVIDLTIDLMDKIYFQPVIEAEREEMARLCTIFLGAKYKDVDLDRPRELPKNSRMGVVVKKPGRDASADEVIEYHRYLMSGCDYESSDSAEDSDVYDDEDDDDNV
ncbi:hypothetical protein D9613_012655 [Agrocybe pediades]|uniref:Uncharacterized protein n=1 Tax=Agrocybe pediades TaxID=84607 RepID=A0A8H4VRW3_9AGAR|nr:hypothetical protein D9613_012655 [Agrocybe pediades]